MYRVTSCAVGHLVSVEAGASGLSLVPAWFIPFPVLNNHIAFLLMNVSPSWSGIEIERGIILPQYPRHDSLWLNCQ